MIRNHLVIFGFKQVYYFLVVFKIMFFANNRSCKIDDHKGLDIIILLTRLLNQVMVEDNGEKT